MMDMASAYTHCQALTPHNFATLSYKSQFTNIDLNDGAFGDHTELCVQWGLRVLLDTNERKMEGSFELGMSYMCLLEPQGLGRNKQTA